MTTTEIKSELYKMIKDQEDKNTLVAIYTLLQKIDEKYTLKSKLSSRAMKAEEDIIAGRVFNKEDIKERTSQIEK